MITGNAISCNIINKIREMAIKRYRISFPFHPNPGNFRENIGILRIIKILMISIINRRAFGCSRKVVKPDCGWDITIMHSPAKKIAAAGVANP